MLGEHLAAAEAWAEAEGARLLAEILEELPVLAEGLGLKRYPVCLAGRPSYYSVHRRESDAEGGLVPGES